MTLVAIPLVVADELTTVSVAPPDDGQLDRKVCGNTKLLTENNNNTIDDEGFVTVILRVLVAVS